MQQFINSPSLIRMAKIKESFVWYAHLSSINTSPLKSSFKLLLLLQTPDHIPLSVYLPVSLTVCGIVGIHMYSTSRHVSKNISTRTVVPVVSDI